MVDYSQKLILRFLGLKYECIYNEVINDLLTQETTQCKVRESLEGIFIQGLKEIPIGSVDEGLEHLDRGDQIRKVAETKLNAQSSRSHTVFRVKIVTKQTIDGIEKEKHSMLNLVDLAGSEAVSKTKAEGIRF